MKTRKLRFFVLSVFAFFAGVNAGVCQVVEGKPVSGVGSDLVTRAEVQLKELGFYSGPVDGVETPLLVGAIRRYQIRQGLEVTGKLNSETMDALGVTGESAPIPENLPAGDGKGGSSSDRRSVVGGEEMPVVKAERVPMTGLGGTRPEEVGRRSYPVSDPRQEYGRMLAGTPYERAPLEVQAMVIHRAQEILSQRGLYHGKLHGAVTPDLEEAVLNYQKGRGLIISGCLDLRTLQRMEMLPGMRAAPVARRSESRAVFKEVP
jgi:hypothetical protein